MCFSKPVTAEELIIVSSTLPVPGVVKDCAANRFRRARCNNIKCILGDNHLSSHPYVI
jgi:hypothetical protein